MLLCDTILRTQNSLPVVMADAHEKFCATLGAAQKFVLDKSLAEVAAGMHVDSLKNIIPSCRAPFTDTWIEVLDADRWTIKEKLEPGKLKPFRVGILLQSDPQDRLRFIAHLFWSFAAQKQEVSTTIFSLIGDLSDDPARLNAMRSMRAVYKLPSNWFDDHVCWYPSPWCATFAARAMMQLPNDEARKKFSLDQMYDWLGELGFWWKVLALLNTRNAAEARDVDLSGLNKARARQGRPTFCEHKILRLRLPGISEQKRSGLSPAQKAHIRGHFVRGHFKQRKTGLYWWSDFFRGDPTRVLRKTYQMESRP